VKWAVSQIGRNIYTSLYETSVSSSSSEIFRTQDNGSSVLRS